MANMFNTETHNKRLNLRLLSKKALLKMLGYNNLKVTLKTNKKLVKFQESN